jgi:hypothetical protein
MLRGNSSGYIVGGTSRANSPDASLMLFLWWDARQVDEVARHLLYPYESQRTPGSLSDDFISGR